ncbi:MAG TPA: hypothetical protein VJR02_03330 [Pyrinomonadaceae bacterium]|nr:hypothetical protein [Pyrinomonadaceae bacterium]
MLGRFILLLTLTSLSIGCHHSAASQSGEIVTSLARVKINTPTGAKATIPLGSGLTIINVFDEFSAGCPTGKRFETLEQFNSMHLSESRLLVIFSEKHFSSQDVENFKAILPMSESMVQGDIEALRPHFIYGKLLVVVDSKGALVWHEKPDMSEQQILSELSNLMNPVSK